MTHKEFEHVHRPISFFDYFYVFVLIIYAGVANIYVRTFSMEKPLAAIFPLILSCVLVIRWKIVFNRQIYLLLSLYTLYFIASTLKYMVIHPVFFVSLFVSFIVTYCTIKAYKFDLFRIFESILYYLAFFSLAMWLVQLILGADNLFSIVSKLPNITTFSSVTGDGLSIVFYSIQPTSFLIFSNSIIPRNCGFAWEPGGFAVYLSLAIFINLFVSRENPVRNVRFWILSLALLTTQSTTGYIIYVIIILFYILQKNIQLILLLVPGIIVLLIVFISLPFISDKISEMINEATTTEIIIEQAIGAGYTTTPQRFTSLIIALKDFYNNPLLGYGGHIEDRWFNRINADLAPISGLGNLLAQYGIMGFVFFIYSTIKSSVLFSRHFNYKGKYLLFIIIFLILISYSLLFLPIVMCFWMFAIFERSNIQT